LQYCHYVAGLVGIGLSRLFSASKLEIDEVGKDEKLANSMGLFLQKTNIIRDYLEDVQQNRHFWPKQVHATQCNL
jgi:farnesyl-diphosphate farnesyltransferase